MFDRFRTLYRWDPANDEAIKVNFDCVLKTRYGDIMLENRNESAVKARKAGFDIPEDRHDFDTMANYPPRFLHPDIWRELCNFWNTDAWRKKSEIGRSNRKKADTNDVISRHTGGSRSYDEYRIILQRKMGRPPTFKELFLATHLTKESKKKFWAGLYDESLEGAEFCTAKSKKAYEAYANYMIEKYGDDVTQHPVGDVELWERARGGSGLRIGSSDLSFVVSGTVSSSSGSTFYTADFQRSQEQVQSLQSQVEVLHNRLEEVQNMREEMQQQMREEMQLQMREEMQRQLAEAMKQFQNPRKSPP